MSPDQLPNPVADEKIPRLLQLAIKKFNAGEYFICHEYLEELWLNKQDQKRELYKGILQIGIALRHLQRENLNGAKHLLKNGLLLIAPFQPVCYGIDLSKLQADAYAVLYRLNDSEQSHVFQERDAIQIQVQSTS